MKIIEILSRLDGFSNEVKALAIKDELSSRLPGYKYIGKTPDSLNAKYNAGWDECVGTTLLGIRNLF